MSNYLNSANKFYSKKRYPNYLFGAPPPIHMKPLDEYISACDDNPELKIHLAASALWHLFEQRYQERTKPRILIRCLDEYGLTKGAALNPMHGQRFAQPFGRVLALLDTQAERLSKHYAGFLNQPYEHSRIAAMAIGDYDEEQLTIAYASAVNSSPVILALPPLILWDCDSQGFAVPLGYNPCVIRQACGAIRVSLSLPETYDIDELMQRF